MADSMSGTWRACIADMEVAMPGSLALDCEDMFKEITKKLYGEEGALEFPDRVTDHEEGSLLKPEDHITAFGLAALMQNGFPPPGILHANFQPKINPAAEDKWTASEESLQWTASRIATYNPAQKLFKCVDCECVGFLSRIAEHWLGTHSNARVFQCPQCTYGSAWARCVRLHLVREHNMPDDRGTDALVKNNPVLDEVTKYLQRLKVKVDSMSPVPGTAAAGRPPSGSPPAGQSNATTPAAGTVKRYGCPSCPYATDRRDLFTRHENIHREEKPFECYVCQKQFNRADHVKKHFLRMHRDHPYDLNRIRRQIPKTTPSNNYYPKVTTDMNQQQNSIEQSYIIRGSHIKTEHNMHQVKAEHDPNAINKGSGSKKKGEKRYTCCYCPWSGVDNWCLKRHLNTHIKPFVCGLCDYKAARSERLATHVSKVHNKKACGKCSFLAEDQTQLAIHLQEQHHVENRSIKVPNTMVRAPSYSGSTTTPVIPSFGSSSDGGSLEPVRVWRPPKQQGAARLFNYMEASDGSDQDDAFPNASGRISYQAVQERNVQDFPKAGDVGNSAEDTGEHDPINVCVEHGTTVTSPAEIAKHSTKRKTKTQKSKKSHNKENKKSKIECNISSLSFKGSGSLEQRNSNSGGTLRSPLLAANGATQHFHFDTTLVNSNNEKDVHTTEELESDEDRHRRSRKQRQPKKVVLDESDIKTQVTNEKQLLTSDNIIKVIHNKTKDLQFTQNVSETNTNISVMSETTISKAVEYKPSKPTKNKMKVSNTQGVTTVYRKLISDLPGVIENINSKMQKKGYKFKSLNTTAITKLIINKLEMNTSSPHTVYKCKRCSMKYQTKYEAYIHYKYCKVRRNVQ